MGSKAFAVHQVGFFFIVLILRSVRYAYESLGVSSSAAIFPLLATLIGSIFNIAIAKLPAERLVSHQVVDFFGMRYRVPVVSHSPGTVIAVNVGGAVIPTLMSIYLLIKRELWVNGLLATAIAALVFHWMAEPVRGLGIAVPVFLPVLVTAIVAMILSREDSAPLAYIAGSLGTLIGADLTNLDKVRGLGAPVASIGGAGTFDGTAQGVEKVRDDQGARLGVAGNLTQVTGEDAADASNASPDIVDVRPFVELGQQLRALRSPPARRDVVVRTLVARRDRFTRWGVRMRAASRA